MKRLLITVALALGIGLFAGTGSALAAPPVPNDPSPFQVDCPGFQVTAQLTGSTKTIYARHPSRNPNLVKLWKEVGIATTVTLTGPAPASKVLRYNINGRRLTELDLNVGDIRYIATGRNLMIVPKVYGTPGLFLSKGRVTWTLNGPVYPNGGMTGPGKITDVCQLLAP
jgi:hypothetical protein